MDLLAETSSITKKSHWADVKKLIREDPRYERVDSSNQREEWFKEHLKTLVKKKDVKEVIN